MLNYTQTRPNSNQVFELFKDLYYIIYTRDG